MIDCVAIGDDIALTLGSTGPLACEVRAASGLTSSKIINIAGGKFHYYCFISAGSFDPTSSKLGGNLQSIRNITNCKYYVWVVPVNNIAALVVETEAKLHSDVTVSFSPGSDNTTPANYSVLVQSIINATNN